MSTVVPINHDNDNNNNKEDSTTTLLEMIPKGTRLEVWWPDDERFYTGRVVGVRNKNNANNANNKNNTKKRKREDWKIRYDDGEVEWLDLRTESYRILSHGDADNNNDNNAAVTPPNDTRAVQVGSLVSVWWEYYGQYYPGVVKRIRSNRTKSFYIQYDDGDVQWEDLSQTKFFLRPAAESSSSDDNDDDYPPLAAAPHDPVPRYV